MHELLYHKPRSIGNADNKHKLNTRHRKGGVSTGIANIKSFTNSLLDSIKVSS